MNPFIQLSGLKFPHFRKGIQTPPVFKGESHMLS